MACLGAGWIYQAMAEDAPQDLLGLARQATAVDAKQAGRGVKELRAAGPAGMAALSQVYSNQVVEHLSQSLAGAVTTDGNWERIRTAFDAVGEQRDAYVSGLYWYTNLDQAMAVARASGKPILSLRLLGRLDEEYSCANSRFFRTTLYPNAEVAKFLRENFILHWQSERPVPRITIDMGDGRRIERTITGNSIHYVLDENGNPVDALPGLYSAHAFIDGLKSAMAAAKESTGMNEADRRAFLQKYHRESLAKIQDEWAGDLAQIGSPVPAKDWKTLESKSGDAIWPRIALLHPANSMLDATTLRIVYAKQPHPTMAAAMRLTTSKSLVETPMMRLIQNLQRSISEDTVRNEYQFHYRIHEWLADPNFPTSLAAVNRVVYAELFLTPDSDPWLGLAPEDRFAALDHGGLVQ